MIIGLDLCRPLLFSLFSKQSLFASWGIEQVLLLTRAEWKDGLVKGVCGGVVSFNSCQDEDVASSCGEAVCSKILLCR